MTGGSSNGGFNPVDLAKMDWKDISLFVLSEVRDLNKIMSEYKCDQKENIRTYAEMSIMIKNLRDMLEEKIQNIETSISVISSKTVSLDKSLEKTQEKLTEVRITVAEKLFYGGVGGAIVTLISKIIEVFLHS
jgi:hypothetical protein